MKIILKLWDSNNFWFLAIVLLGLTLRFYGINWDQGYHLHPDERFLTMVGNDTRIPTSIFEYFDTANSPLNPYNYPNYKFFVYGTFPLFLVKFIAHLFLQDTYDYLLMWGRGMSALFDVGTIVLIYLISRKVNSRYRRFQLVPPLFYAFSVLPIQLSHFFAVDTFLNFFLVATFTSIIYQLPLLAGICFGLAISSKITAIFFLPIILLILFFKYRQIFEILKNGTIMALLTIIFFRITTPYAFVGVNFNPDFINSLKNLQSYSILDIGFPPMVQWMSTVPYIFPLKNIAFWGIGIFAFVYFLISLLKFKLSGLKIIFLVWVIGLFLFQSSQTTYALRYFLIIIPFLYLLFERFSPELLFVLVCGHILFGISFINIYRYPHTRVSSSSWIYQNIAPNSVLSSEYWDDPLPLYFPNSSPADYTILTLSLFSPDSPDKWFELNQQLSQIDYLVMSSNRLWGSIPKLPDIYPLSTKFYQQVFDSYGYQLVHKNVVYPGFPLPIKKCLYIGSSVYPTTTTLNQLTSFEECPNPGIYLRDDNADESFTVYDHPQVLIFSKQK